MTFLWHLKLFQKTIDLNSMQQTVITACLCHQHPWQQSVYLNTVIVIRCNKRMVLAIDFYYYLVIGGLAPAINVFIPASTFTLFLNTVAIIFNKIYLKLDEAGDMRYNYISNDNPYQLTSNQLFHNLYFNDVILHFINLIKIYHAKVLNLTKIPDGKKKFQLVIDTVDYVIFELDKFGYFITFDDYHQWMYLVSIQMKHNVCSIF